MHIYGTELESKSTFMLLQLFISKKLPKIKITIRNGLAAWSRNIIVLTFGITAILKLQCPSRRTSATDHFKQQLENHSIVFTFSCFQK